MINFQKLLLFLLIYNQTSFCSDNNIPLSEKLSGTQIEDGWTERNPKISITITYLKTANRSDTISQEVVKPTSKGCLSCFFKIKGKAKIKPA